MILTPLHKLPNNEGDLGKVIVATSFEWFPKVQKNRPIWSHCFPLRQYYLVFSYISIFVKMTQKEFCH